MDGAWLSLASTLAGGLIGISGSFALDRRRDRATRLAQWDERRTDAIVALCVAAQAFEGAQQRRGRALRNGDREALPRRIEESKDAATALRGASVTVELLMSEVADELDHLRQASRWMCNLNPRTGSPRRGHSAQR